MDLAARSRAALDWPDLLAELAARAHSDAGRAACLALPLHDDVDEARRHMAAVDELATLLRRGETLPGLSVRVGILSANAMMHMSYGEDDAETPSFVEHAPQQSHRIRTPGDGHNDSLSGAEKTCCERWRGRGHRWQVC